MRTCVTLFISLLVMPHLTYAAAIPDDALFQLRAEMLQSINKSRSEEGLSLLSYSMEIERVAQKHAEDTAEHFDPETVETREATYLAHTSSKGLNLQERFQDANVQSGWGFAENTGYWVRAPYGDLLDASRYGLMLMHQGMMAEVPPNDSHKKNILGAYTHIGVGIALLAEPDAIENAVFLVTNFSRYSSEEEEIAFRKNMTENEAPSRSLLQAALIPSHGGPFIDVRPSHPYVDAIAAVQARGVIRGYDDGTFKPEQTVSRSEILKMLLDAVEFSPIGREFSQCFADVFNEWYAPYVCLAKRNDWVTGYPDQTFRPVQPVTRAEGITLSARVMDLKEPESDVIPFQDVPNDAWYRSPLLAMTFHKLIPFEDKFFFPIRGLERGEVAAILDRALAQPELIPTYATTPEQKVPRTLQDALLE